MHLWVYRVNRVAQVHHASKKVTLLAASSKLVKAAKRWYELQSGTVSESWSSLRNEIIKIFHKRISFYVAMQRVEARQWNCDKETFDQYAMDKLSLMHSLNLQDADAINLLIGGIMKSSLRATALTLAVDTIDQFLSKMRVVTEDIADLERNSQVPSKANRPRDVTCRKCGKKGIFNEIVATPRSLAIIARRKVTESRNAGNYSRRSSAEDRRRMLLLRQLPIRGQMFLPCRFLPWLKRVRTGSWS